MRTISQFDAQRYKTELESLRDDMTDILLEMEQRHSTSSGENFSKWWDEGGVMRHYFDLKGKAERIEQILAFSAIEEEEYPKMRGAASSVRTGRGGTDLEEPKPDDNEKQ